MEGQEDTRRREVLETITRHLVEEFAAVPAAVAENTVILEIEDADSVKQLRLTNRLEQEWGVVLMDEESTIAVTVGDLADQIVAALDHRATALGN